MHSRRKDPHNLWQGSFPKPCAQPWWTVIEHGGGLEDDRSPERCLPVLTRWTVKVSIVAMKTGIFRPHPVVELRKTQWGTTPRCRKRRDFNAVYYMGVHNRGGGGGGIPRPRSNSSTGRIVCKQCIDAATATDVARSMIGVSVCRAYGRAEKKTAEQIEMPFGGWLMWTEGTIILDEGPHPPREGTHLRGHMPAHCDISTHEFIVHCSPAATGKCACPEHAADECICRRQGWQDADAAFCQITLDTFKNGQH